MSGVAAKLIDLPTWAKILGAVAIAIFLGVVTYFIFGPVAGVASGASVLIGNVLSLFRAPGDGAKKYISDQREAAERELEHSRDAVERESRSRAAARLVEAERVARDNLASDDGDPRRVFERHRQPGPPED